MSFCNGSVVEFGRKIWAPEQERPGVETYSSTWGKPRSLLALSAAAAGAWGGLLAFGIYTGRPGTTATCGLAVFAYLLKEVASFRAAPSVRAQKRLETASGVWVLLCYLIAAAAPSLPVAALW